jgi:hypothetical protein
MEDIMKNEDVTIKFDKKFLNNIIDALYRYSDSYGDDYDGDLNDVLDGFKKPEDEVEETVLFLRDIIIELEKM